MGSKSKGSQSERDLVNALDAAGYAVMRSPSSGSGTEREQPDVLAGNARETIADEHKYEGSTDGIIYLTEDEIAGLEFFAKVFDAIPVVSTRWKRDTTFYFFELGQLEDVDGDSGNKRVTRSMIGDPAATLADGSRNSVGDFPHEVQRRGGLLL